MTWAELRALAHGADLSAVETAWREACEERDS